MPARRLVPAFLLCLGLCALTACVGATRMVTRQRGSSGQQFEAKSFDTTLVQPGITTREEVVAKFPLINSGY